MCWHQPCRGELGDKVNHGIVRHLPQSRGSLAHLGATWGEAIPLRKIQWREPAWTNFKRILQCLSLGTKGIDQPFLCLGLGLSSHVPSNSFWGLPYQVLFGFLLKLFKIPIGMCHATSGPSSLEYNTMIYKTMLLPLQKCLLLKFFPKRNMSQLPRCIIILPVSYVRILSQQSDYIF